MLSSSSTTSRKRRSAISSAPWPRRFGRRDVARAVLRLPGEAFAHGVPDDLVGEPRQRVALAGMPGALDELHHADAPAAPERAQRRPKAAVDLPLPVPVWTISRPFSIGLGGDLGVLHRLALRHLGAMAFGFLVVDCFVTMPY